MSTMRSSTPVSGGSGARRHNSASSTTSSSMAARTPQRSGPAPAQDSPTSTHVETSVTKLLVTTKQLLESLTMWSQGRATAEQVSDHFVATGNYFNVAVTAFTKERIPMDELMSVPDDLRNCLEEALSQDASDETLHRYLPRVRDTIVLLLHGLKAKQNTFRARREAALRAAAAANASSSSSSPTESHLSGRGSPDQRRPSVDGQRYPNGLPAGIRPARRELPPEPGASRRPAAATEAQPPSREPSLTKSRSGTSLAAAAVPPRSATARFNENAPPMPRSSQQQPQPAPAVRPGSSLANRPSTPPPMIQRNPRPSDPPQLPDLKLGSSPNGPSSFSNALQEPSVRDSTPPPELDRLNSSTTLERRASKRYSQYTYSKIASSASSSALPMVPGGSGAGSGVGTSSGAVAGEQAETSIGRELVQSARQPRAEGRPLGPPVVRKPPIEGLPAHPRANGAPRPSRPLSAMQEADNEGSSDGSRPSSVSAPKMPLPALPTTNGPTPPPISHARSSSVASSRGGGNAATEDSNVKAASYPMTVYLQLGRDIRKAVLDEQPSLGTLRVLFTERFQYNPGMNDFPAIYLRDPREQHGIQYELEDVTDIRERCVLSLNIEPLDAVKEQIATGLASLQQELKAALTASVASLQQEMKDLHSSVATVSARRGSIPISSLSPSLPIHASTSTPGSPSLGRPTDKQFTAAAQKMLKNSSSSPRLPGSTPKIGSSALGRSDSPTTSTHSAAGDAKVSRIVDDLKSHYDEVQAVRREIGTLRQVVGDFGTETKATLTGLRQQAGKVRHLAASKVGADRATIRAGKEGFEKRMDDLIPRLEELQDTVDDLRTDVSSRGVRPRPQQIGELRTKLDALNVEVEAAKTQLATLGPAWKHGWEQELEVIIREQEFLRQQEPLLRDASADVATLMQVFETIVEYASAVGVSSSGGGVGQHKLRPAPRVAMAPVEPGDHGSVMASVRALAPDPDRRLRAIEQAERAREQENASRTDAFKDELGGFVEGKRLRKTGGAEEADRVREVKSNATLRAMFSGDAGPLPELPSSPPFLTPTEEGSSLL